VLQSLNPRPQGKLWRILRYGSAVRMPAGLTFIAIGFAFDSVLPRT
jgi:hypothetical protein